MTRSSLDGISSEPFAMAFLASQASLTGGLSNAYFWAGMGVATQATQPQQSSTALSSMASPLPPVLGKPRLDQAQSIYGRLRSIAHYCEAINGRPPELAAQVARVCIYMQWKKKNIDSRIVEGKWSGQCRGMAALPLFLRRSIPSCART